MGQLTNLYVSESYQGLIKLADSTAGVTNTLQYTQDGVGNNLPIQISTTEVNITGSLTVNGQPIEFSNTGSFATTGSNQFSGSQEITGALNLVYYDQPYDTYFKIAELGAPGGDYFQFHNNVTIDGGNLTVNGDFKGNFITDKDGTNVLTISGSQGVNISGSLHQSGTFYPDVIDWFSSSIVQNTGSYVLTTDDLGVTQYDSYQNIALALDPYISGSTGSSGTSGSSGSSGTSGTDGISGTNGTDGTSGTNGADGTNGTNGIDGTSGTNGANGTSGTSGNNGTSGSSGTSGLGYGSISFNGNINVQTNPTLSVGTTNQSFGYKGTADLWTTGQYVTFSDQNSSVIYFGQLRIIGAGGFGLAFGLQEILSVSGSSTNSTSSDWTMEFAAAPAGTSGTSGSSGSSGSSGTNGIAGTNGTSGSSGSSGSSGTSGSSGQNGISAGLTYYFNQSQSSDVSPYKVLTVNPSGAAQQLITTALSNNQQNVLVSSFLTPELGFSVIPAGVQRFHAHFLKQASNDNIQTYITIELANSSGVGYGTILSTGQAELGWIDASTPVETTVDLTLPTTTINTTDRMIVKIYLSNNDSSSHSINWYTEGTSYYSFVLTSVGQVSGTSGTSGTSGANGTSGTDGSSGSSGSSGTSFASPYVGNVVISGSLTQSGSLVHTGSLFQNGNVFLKPENMSAFSTDTITQSIANQASNILGINNITATFTGSVQISGSNNILLQAQRIATPAGSQGIISGSNNIVSTGILTLQSGSLSIPGFNNNIGTAAPTITTNFSGSTPSSFTNNMGNLGFVVNSNSGSTTITGNNIQGSLTVNNNVSSSASNQASLTVNRNLINGLSHILSFSGNTVGAAGTSKTVNDSYIGGNSNTIFSNTTDNTGSLLSSLVYGNNLVVSASNTLLATTIGGMAGSTFLGRWNDVGTLANSFETVFAVGAGTNSSNRRTALYVSASSLTGVRYGLNVSGGLNLSGSFDQNGTVNLRGIGSQPSYTSTLVYDTANGAVGYTSIASGTSGTSGANGTSGTDGIAGTSGSSGSSGTSFASPYVGNIIVSGSVKGNVNALSISSQTASLDCSVGNFFTLQLVSGSATNINPSNITPGQTINIKLATTGSGTVTFPTSVKQISGSNYVPTTTTGTDIITLISFDTSNIFLASVKNLV